MFDQLFQRNKVIIKQQAARRWARVGALAVPGVIWTVLDAKGHKIAERCISATNEWSRTHRKQRTE